MPEALVNIRLDHKRMREIINEVAKVENVTWARLVFGPTDGVVYIETERWLELETTVFNISTVDGVLEPNDVTDTFDKLSTGLI